MRKLPLTRLGVAALAAVIIMGVLPRPAAAQSAAMLFTMFCARCHGATGHGDGDDAASLSTKPQDFHDCAAMAKKPDDQLFNAVKGGGTSVGLPSDMPAWGTGLNDQQIHDLVAYVRGFCK